MSLYNKKKTLALALAAAMVAPAAYAYNVTTDADLNPEVVATQVGSEVTMTEDVELNVELGDIIVGRTTGFQLLITLRDGATFGDVAPALTNPADALTGTWAINLAAGGTPGSTQAQFTFEPQAAGSTVSDGVLATLVGLELDDVAVTDGAITRARFLLRDPVSTATLHDYTPNLIVRDDGVAITCTAEDQPYRIDVGQSASFDPKTAFVDFPYEIGGAEFVTASLGTIDVDTTAGLTLDGTDTLTSTITGDFEGFTDVFLAADDTCAVSIGDYTINAAGDTATLEETVTDLGGSTGATSTGGNLCVTVDGETQLAAQSFGIQNSLTVTPGTDEIVIAGGACNVAPLQYNGSVVDVYHVNPAGNTTAQSFIRVINPSNLDGNVTVVGWDDNGTMAGPISFNLPAGNSKQFNSVDLEEGAVAKGITGSFGNGAGKWRLEVTGEFDGMMVQGLNRNQNDGTITNLTDADAQTEQQFLHNSNGGFFIP